MFDDRTIPEHDEEWQGREVRLLLAGRKRKHTVHWWCVVRLDLRISVRGASRYVFVDTCSKVQLVVRAWQHERCKKRLPQAHVRAPLLIAVKAYGRQSEEEMDVPMQEASGRDFWQKADRRIRQEEWPVLEAPLSRASPSGQVGDVRNGGI